MWSYFLNRVTCLVKADSNSERQTGWGGGVGGTSERAYKRDKINVTEMEKKKKRKKKKEKKWGGGGGERETFV